MKVLTGLAFLPKVHFIDCRSEKERSIWKREIFGGKKKVFFCFSWNKEQEALVISPLFGVVLCWWFYNSLYLLDNFCLNSSWIIILYRSINLLLLNTRVFVVARDFLLITFPPELIKSTTRHLKMSQVKAVTQNIDEAILPQDSSMDWEGLQIPQGLEPGNTHFDFRDGYFIVLN